jgi:hypothetical protein
MDRAALKNVHLQNVLFEDEQIYRFYEEFFKNLFAALKD